MFLTKVTFVVPCMGRMHHLKCSYPTMIRHARTLVVGWCDPEPKKWIENNFVGGFAYHRHAKDGAPNHFNASKARNMGAAAVHDDDWVYIMDCDVVLPHDFSEIVTPALKDDHFILIESWRKRQAGCVAVRKKHFTAVGGYTELEGAGYGMDDTHFIQKLQHIGLQGSSIPDRAILHIEHGEEDRVRHYANKDRSNSMADNIERYNRALEEFKTAWDARK